MRSFFQTWWQALRLPLHNRLRSEYRRRHHGWDPADNLIVMIFIITSQCIFTYLTVKYDLLATKSTTLGVQAFLGSFGVVISLVLILIFGTFYNAYADLMRRAADEMSMPIADLENWEPLRLKELARSCLIYLARELHEMEKEHPSYFPEVIRARNNFDRAYKLFLETGLIADSGWKPYFTSK